MTDSSNTLLYRGMDRAALDKAYNNTAAVADSPSWLDAWRKRSAVVRARKDAVLGIAYGERERERIDYFPSGKQSAPLFVFIHGGYWIRNSIDMFSFIADGPTAHGIDVAMLGYTLVPDVRLADVVTQIRNGLTYLQLQADLGFDSEHIYVGGWSAGGHLAAMAADHPAVRGIVPISGIFDLEPLSLNYLNDVLQLTQADIETLSPVRDMQRELPPHRVFVGGRELPELQRQSEDFKKAASAAAIDATLDVLPDFHHYSILDELANPEGKIALALNALASKAEAGRRKA